MPNRMLNAILEAMLILIFLGFSAFCCHAAQFSSELIITSPQGDFTYNLKVKDDLMRLQKTAGPMTVPPFPTLYNQSSGVTWGLMPQMHQYVEEIDPVKTMVMNPVAGWKYMRKGMSATPAGTETVEGYICDVVEYREAGKETVAYRAWTSQALAFDVKTMSYATNGNATMVLRNIKEAPQDAALFIIPEGYTKVGPAKKGTDSPAMKTEQENTLPASSSNIVFILDSSGSMWGQVEGIAKIVIAKEVLTGLVQELPDESTVGLVAYGHRRKGDCDDVEELIPLGQLDKEKMIAKIQALSPKGKTPISRSVRLTAERLKNLEDETSIILVSDGKETCDPDPCGFVKYLKASGIKFVLHVIGFDVTKEEREQLECMAKAGGGNYYTAGNAREFLAAAREVVEAPTFNGGFLKVTSVKEDQPFNATVSVYRKSDNKYMGDKSTWYQNKPAEYKLMPGSYALKVIDRSVTPNQTQEIRDIEIVSGQVVRKTITFGGAGILRINTTKEDQPFNATVSVYRQSDNKSMGNKSTWYQNKPAEYKLMPGSYFLRVEDRSVMPYQTLEVHDIEIVSGQTLEKRLSFVKGGILQVGTVKEGQPFNATVSVYRQNDNKSIGNKSTWYQNKPAEYKLMPGIYYLKVVDRSKTPYKIEEIHDIEIVSGKMLEKSIEF